MRFYDSRRAFINNVKAVSGTSLVLAALSPAQAADAKKGASGGAGAPGLGIFDVRQYGAKGDGKTLDSAAIQSAIDACTRAGGGIVVLPNGTYLSGTIELKDYVTLHLAPQAVLFGSPNISDYPFKDAGLSDFGYSPTPVPTCALVYAYRAKGIAIEGTGVIDGHSSVFRPMRGPRPRLLFIHECSDVAMQEVTLKDAGNWTGHFAVCDHLRVHGVKIRSYGAGNSDGIDIDSCREVSISDCDIAAGDDVICLKSTYPQPCQNVVVTNCTLRTYSNALKLGTASVGGFHNITFSNCAIYDALRGGIKVETVDGGDLWNVTFSNITMENVGTPIFIRLGNRAADYGNPGIQKPRPIGSLKGVLISNVRARVTKTDGRFWPLVLSNQPDPTRHADIYGCSITGIPGHEVENVSLENVSITFAPGGTIEHARRLDVPELEQTYPESGMFGVLPAYGFYIRHAKGVTLANVRIDVDGMDMRPAIICDNVEDLELAGLKAAPPSGSEPLLRFRNARNVFVHGSRPLAPVETFLLVEGQRSTAIALVANDLRQAKTSVISAPDASPGTVQESANVRAV